MIIYRSDRVYLRDASWFAETKPSGKTTVYHWSSMGNNACMSACGKVVCNEEAVLLTEIQSMLLAVTANCPDVCCAKGQICPACAQFIAMREDLMSAATKAYHESSAAANRLDE